MLKRARRLRRREVRVIAASINEHVRRLIRIDSGRIVVADGREENKNEKNEKRKKRKIEKMKTNSAW